MSSTRGYRPRKSCRAGYWFGSTFLGAIVALRQHAHLGVDTLVRALPPLGRKICFIASYVLMLYADWLLTLGSWKQAVLTFGDSAPASGISVGLFFYSSGLVFGVSAAVILLLDLFRVLSGRASEEDAISVKESEEHLISGETARDVSPYRPSPCSAPWRWGCRSHSR